MVNAMVTLKFLELAMQIIITKPTLLLIQKMMLPCPMTRMEPDKQLHLLKTYLEKETQDARCTNVIHHCSATELVDLKDLLQK